LINNIQSYYNLTNRTKRHLSPKNVNALESPTIGQTWQPWMKKWKDKTSTLKVNLWP